MKLFFSLHCTKINPIALMCLSPLSAENFASFPHVLESSCLPPAPNPILESQVPHRASLLLRIPILTLAKSLEEQTALKPSLSQLRCKDASEPTSFFQLLRPRKVARYCPSAISVNNELACLFIVIKLTCWPIFIPRQILDKDVSQ